MRALITDGTTLKLAERHPEPEVAPGEALISTIKVGVSGADAALCSGLLNFRGVPGRVFVGVVEKARDGDPFELAGRRVVGAITTRCGTCDLCQRGLGAHCRSRTILGMQGRDGCLAERFALPMANLVAVPNSIDDDHAVFAMPLASALHTARQLTIEGRPYITVLGDGLLGLLTAQVMGSLNASVRLVGRHQAKLAICEKWGLKHRHVDEIGQRSDQDIVVDCTGSPGGLKLAMRLVRPRGTIVMKSLLQRDEPIDLTPLVLHEIDLVGSVAAPIAEAVGALERREVDVVSLISRRMSLSDGPAILQVAAQPEMIQVLVEP